MKRERLSKNEHDKTQETRYGTVLKIDSYPLRAARFYGCSKPRMAAS